MFAGCIVLVVIILLILVAIDASRHKDEDLSNRGIAFCEGDDCPLDGRPFRDVRGHDISASTETCLLNHKDEQNLWSTIQGMDHPPSGQGIESLDSQTVQAQEENEWLTRALGEHASIASFAAFTIALMTNQAPPDLIRDALQAAMDEWNHATVSFAWANHMATKGELFHEPTGLPATQHVFERDLKQLARSTVLEGCMGETLSALDMANQVDVKRNATTKVPPAMLLSMEKIAFEEAQHAALAWRTIQWVCTTDDHACNDIQKDVLNDDAMDTYFGQRFPLATQAQRKLWQYVYQNLIPFAKSESRGVDCTSSQKGALAENVAENIIQLCWCQASQHVNSEAIL